MKRELSDRARALLERAVVEERPLAPDTAHRARLKRSLLQGAALGQAPLAAAAATAGGGATQLVLFAKSLSVGLLVSAALVGGARGLTKHDLPEPAPRGIEAPSARAPQKLSPGAGTKTETGEAPSTTPPADAPPDVEAAPPISRSAPSVEAAAATLPALALRDELALLTAAQAALRDGHAAESLTILERYDGAFPGGQLLGERLAAEVFAACQLGDRARATRAATRFLQHDAGSLLAERVRRSCALQNAGSY